MKIVKLFAKENTKFHFGQLSLEIDDAVFHSDSLFSCLCHNYVRNYGNEEIGEFITNFPLITSLFYGTNMNGRDILFVSKPKKFIFPKTLTEKDRKLPKKIKFVSMGLLEKSNAASEDEWDKLKEIDIAINSARNTAWLMDECKADISLFGSAVDEKVSVDRTSGTSKDKSLYAVSSVTLTENAFFFFLVSEVDEKLETGIKALKTFGIGGELTAGYGQIERISIEEFNSRAISGDYSAYTNLSIVFPKKEEIAVITDEKAAYDLIERKGFVYCSSKKRKSCVGLKEGSVFSQMIKGDIMDVKPDDKTPAKRYGKAFLLPFRVRS